MEHPTVLMAYHDDWLVNVLLSTGQVYTFVTELWDEWNDVPDSRLYSGELVESDWTPIIEAASRKALEFCRENVETWGLDPLPESIAQFRSGMDSLHQLTSDRDFRRFTSR
jgi:hypothetical protein